MNQLFEIFLLFICFYRCIDDSANMDWCAMEHDFEYEENSELVFMDGQVDQCLSKLSAVSFNLISLSDMIIMQNEIED